MFEVVCDEDAYCDRADFLAFASRLSAVGGVVEVEEEVSFHDVVISLVSESRICDLHEEFFQDDSLTDVITFPAPGNGAAGRCSGDIAICAAVARTQAIETGQTLVDELVFLGTHGLLHLCGWDDGTDLERDRMLRRQSELIRRASDAGQD